MQACEPSVFVYEPAEQEGQLAEEYKLVAEPAKQSKQAVAPELSALYLPGTQFSQAIALVVLTKVPVKQGEHDLVAGVAAMKPG